VGHDDSNWKQLEVAGFNLPQAKLFPVLSGEDLITITKKYSDILKQELDKADYKIGLFGIGSDGHTAGILPHSPALTSHAFAHAYEASPFVRITMTPKAIELLDEAVVFAQGETKWPVIRSLLHEDIALH